jgi:hypothetical protein
MGFMALLGDLNIGSVTSEVAFKSVVKQAVFAEDVWGQRFVS